MFHLLRDGELAVIPGADHGAFFSTAGDTFQSMILGFLLRRTVASDEEQN